MHLAADLKPFASKATATALCTSRTRLAHCCPLHTRCHLVVMRNCPLQDNTSYARNNSSEYNAHTRLELSSPCQWQGMVENQQAALFLLRLGHTVAGLASTKQLFIALVLGANWILTTCQPLASQN